VFPAIVAVPLREVVPLFEVHEAVTLPVGPLPLDAESVIQESFEVAFQLPPMQPVGRPVIETLCDPELLVGLTEVGEIAKPVQDESEMSF
jgi:hypothetical protein